MKGTEASDCMSFTSVTNFRMNKALKSHRNFNGEIFMSFVKTFRDKLIILKKYVEGTKMKKESVYYTAENQRSMKCHCRQRVRSLEL